jgi:phosphate starvation-inducible PhoH-like protein|tara:strand:- start:3130 stop:3807 length:678 start_codon:yes stop_codon:yes gene_type:complete
MSKKRKTRTTKSQSQSGIDFSPLDDSQKEALKVIKDNSVTFLHGAAGTGKTTLAVAYSLRSLFTGSTQKIVITRPYVCAGEQLGHLPGDLNEKFDPFFAPVKIIFEKFLVKTVLNRFFRNEQIIAYPVAFMRGVTFDNTIVILDEAQNCTKEQMHMVLTRLGHNSKIICTGDEFQSDIPENNGLEDALDRLKGVNEVGYYELPLTSCYRHEVVANIEERYRSKRK